MEIRNFVDSKEHAEYRRVVRARGEGYQEGQSHGFKFGLSAGIVGMLAVYIIVNLAGKVIG